MTRQIISQTSSGMMANAANSPQEDTYTSILLKLIPADIIGVYISVSTLINSVTNPHRQSLQWALFLIVFLITPFYLRRTGVTSWKQILLCMLSLIIWVITIGGPLEGYKFWDYTPQFLGSLILPVYTLLIPVAYRQP